MIFFPLYKQDTGVSCCFADLTASETEKSISNLCLMKKKHANTWLKPLWIDGFFSQLISLLNLSVITSNLWAVKSEFYFAWKNPESNKMCVKEKIHLPETQGQSFIFSPQQIHY